MGTINTTPKKKDNVHNHQLNLEEAKLYEPQ